MAIQVKVNGVDKSNQVDWQSVQRDSVLTRQPDTFKFRVKNYGTKTWRPAVGDTVQLIKDAVTVFGGVVVNSTETIQGLALFFNVTCKDYSQTLDRIVVNENYTAMTGNAIIADILTNFTDPAEGFTGTNVNVPDTVQLIAFNYISVSSAIQKLCDYLGGYVWYVDANKDLHVFKQTTVLAPFNIADTGTTGLRYHSLQIDQDFTQVRNHIYLQGGQVTGTTVQNDQVADGQQVVFFVGYDLSNLLVYKALAASPTVFNALTVGRDGIDAPASFDCLYNPNNGLIIFPNGTKPAVNDIIRYSGVPIFPLLAEKLDPVSIALYGEYQSNIVDKSIKSLAAASQRLGVELLKYANPIVSAKFETVADGLVCGQQITINSAIRNINQNFVIQRVRLRCTKPDEFVYSVECQAINTAVYGIIDALDKLLVQDPADNLVTEANPILQKLVSGIETIAFTESVTSSISHNPTAETITMTEANFPQPGNYATVWVLGPYTPTVSVNGADKKRVFILDGSYLS